MSASEDALLEQPETVEQDRFCAEIIADYEEYVNPSLAKLFRFMGLNTVEERSCGVYIYDNYGREYLDCLGGYGVFNLGHSHPQVIAAVKNQLDKMPLSSKILFSAPQGQLAALLAKITPGDLQYSFFCNSGAEAVEGALKLARLATGRNKIISTINAFHGKTLGALSATGRAVFRQPCEPLLPNFVHVPFGDISALAAQINADTAAVIVEPIQGEGGIIVPPISYLAEVRELCNEYGSLLIADEVQTGMGRTGKLFACEHSGVVPDILTLAKGLGGGVMPIGAIVARPKVWDVLITHPFLHTSTFGGNPLACTAAIATLKVLLSENLAIAAAIKGEYFLEHLGVLQTNYPEILREVRGCGLMIGLDLVEEGFAGYLMAEMFDQSILAAYTLNNPQVIRLEPPLIINKQEIDRVLQVLDKALQKIKAIHQ